MAKAATPRPATRKTPAKAGTGAKKAPTPPAKRSAAPKRKVDPTIEYLLKNYGVLGPDFKLDY